MTSSPFSNFHSTEHRLYHTLVAGVMLLAFVGIHELVSGVAIAVESKLDTEQGWFNWYLVRESGRCTS